MEKITKTYVEKLKKRRERQNRRYQIKKMFMYDRTVYLNGNYNIDELKSFIDTIRIEANQEFKNQTKQRQKIFLDFEEIF